MSVASPATSPGVRPSTDSPIAYYAVDLTPSVSNPSILAIAVSSSVPAGATALAVPVAATGAAPTELGVDRDALEAAGFSGKAGQLLVLPRTSGPTLVAVG